MEGQLSVCHGEDDGCNADGKDQKDVDAREDEYTEVVCARDGVVASKKGVEVSLLAVEDSDNLGFPRATLDVIRTLSSSDDDLR